MTLKEYTGKWNLDTTHSTVGFTVRHAGISKVRGNFETFSGEVEVPENIADNTVKAVVELSSINTNNKDRDAHLKSGDFFNTEENETMEFIGKVVDESRLVGELTLLGNTKEVEVDLELLGLAVDAYGNQRAGAEATTTISRKDFGLTWNVALEAGGVLVSDKVAITLELSFIKE